jgi:hypothetical protein
MCQTDGTVLEETRVTVFPIPSYVTHYPQQRTSNQGRIMRRASQATAWNANIYRALIRHWNIIDTGLL